MADQTTHLENLQQALASLNSSMEILTGFNHRNKNQHRHSKWWAEFDILRRSARKLPDDLQVTIAKHSRRAPRRKKTEPTSVADPATERGRWLRDQCIPRTYLAFTQLAADNQYAALGLLLLGVLADINTAVSLILEDDAQPAEVLTSHPAAVSAQASVVEFQSVEEVGVVVSREKHEDASQQNIGGQDGKGRKGVSKSVSASKRRTVSVVDKDSGSASKRNRERKRGGDEFDDLFSSLL